MAKTTNEKLITYKFSQFLSPKLNLRDNKLYFGDNVSVIELMEVLKIDLKNIIKVLKDKTLTENIILNKEQIGEIALSLDLDFEHVVVISELNVINNIDTLVKTKDFYFSSDLRKRPPIITIMGHVDHGKTTLLDFIKKTNIVSQESGGITQRIGAYTINNNGKKITFIDTPGHEAFTQMRANGSQVTDIVVLVVAADDSIMPQTKESIDHAKAAKVPIIVAINKIDKPNADIERVKSELSDYGVMPEEWGGDTQFIEISAIKGDGVDDLLETINLRADLLELKASYNVISNGTVIESNINSKMGNMVSIIVRDGVLNVGDNILLDNRITRIKAMYDSNFDQIKSAQPSESVELFGLGFSPKVGSKYSVISDLKDAKKVVSSVENFEKTSFGMPKKSIDDLFKSFIAKNDNKVKIILKTSSLGSLEAIKTELLKIDKPHGKVEIIRADIGEVSKADLSLAEASNANIYLFDLKSKPKSNLIEVFAYDIIYKLLEDVEDRVDGFKKPELVEERIGEFEILKIFESSKFGIILGSSVTDGKITKTSKVKLIDHKENLLFESDVKTLKIEKNNVKEVKKGKEFGVIFENMNYAFKENTRLLVFEEVEKSE